MAFCTPRKGRAAEFAPPPLADLTEDDLPFSDGQPMADSGRRADAAIYAREAQRVRYAQRADVAI